MNERCRLLDNVVITGSHECSRTTRGIPSYILPPAIDDSSRLWVHLTTYMMIAERLLLVTLLIGGATYSTDAHGQHGHDDQKRNSAFQKKGIIQDTDHIKEHVGAHVTGVDEMKPEELQFHFFITHDINMDKKLDGLEIYFSLEHAMDHLSEGPGTFNSTEAQERVIGMADEVLKTQDLDQDGYLTYAEFSLGHRRAAEERDTTQKAPPPTERPTSHGY